MFRYKTIYLFRSIQHKYLFFLFSLLNLRWNIYYNRVSSLKMPTLKLNIYIRADQKNITSRQQYNPLRLSLYKSKYYCHVSEYLRFIVVMYGVQKWK